MRGSRVAVCIWLKENSSSADFALDRKESSWRTSVM